MLCLPKVRRQILRLKSKAIVMSGEILNSVKQQSDSQSRQIESLRSRIDGLQTILEGLTEKSQNNKIELSKMLSAQETLQMSEQERLKLMEESVRANEQNILKLKTLMDELSVMIDTLNSNYVTKDDYNRLVNDVNDFKVLVGKELKNIGRKATSTAGSSDPYANMNSRTLAKLAFENYNKLYFSKAIPQYEELIRRKHKPAYAHYMIGEMWHYRKKYDKAISYYKASAALYDKASYMPTLLLHTAESMEKTGDYENAKAFYQAVVLKYPDSKEAKSAQQRLDNP
ncbi:MAG: hypothetical protein B5M52_08235 [Helicobacteraceae bacterium 4484_230]|nr:MAG: hypothetical protein B5M52_08235 [Helicobacteraceae bacterium 4484_230]